MARRNYTVAEVAAENGVSTDTVRRLIASGILKARTIRTRPTAGRGTVLVDAKSVAAVFGA
jgi:hypothetical protein